MNSGAAMVAAPAFFRKERRVVRDMVLAPKRLCECFQHNRRQPQPAQKSCRFRIASESRFGLSVDLRRCLFKILEQGGTKPAFLAESRTIVPVAAKFALAPPGEFELISRKWLRRKQNGHTF